MVVNERKVLRTCSEGRSTAAAGGFEKEDGKKSGLKLGAALFVSSRPPLPISEIRNREDNL